MSTNKKNPKFSIGIDLGSAFLAICIFFGRKCMPVECPINGSQIATIAYIDKDGNWHVGRDAILRSYSDTGDNLYMHAKRNLLDCPDKKVYGGRFTPVDVITQFLRHAFKLLLSVYPSLGDFPQFGGFKESSDDLSIVVTTPAVYSIEQNAYLEQGMAGAGFQSFDGFVPEPIAAARRMASHGNVSLKDGDKVMTLDIGAGTTDISLLKYDRGVLHQLAAASGDSYLAGHDFTAAIAEAIAKDNRISWKGAYGKGGLNLHKISAKLRPAIVAIFFAAEEAKKGLSVLDEVTVAVDLPKGRVTFTIDRKRAFRLWAELFDSFKKCISDSMTDTDLGFESIDHFMLVGGSSLIPMLREAFAEVVGRDASHILVCADSEYIVAGGAAEHGFYRDEASRVLEEGFGCTMLDSVTREPKNIPLISTGEIISSEGLYVNRKGFKVENPNGNATLAIKPFVGRTGVRFVVVEDRDTYLSASEIVPLQEVTASMEQFPEGELDVEVGVKVDPVRNLWLIIRPTSGHNVEPLSIPLQMCKKNDNVDTSDVPLEVLLILDCSLSMHGGKIKMLKQGAEKFCRFAVQSGAHVGVIRFPGVEEQQAWDPAKLICHFTRDWGAVNEAVHRLDADGGTPMAEALELATECFSRRENSAQFVAVLFTDGVPNDPDGAVDKAEVLKNSARLITIGIGNDVQAAWLQSLASSPDDYRYADAPKDILAAFDDVSQILWNSSNLNDGMSTENEATDDLSEYNDEWDELEEKEVA